jgi:hypothetical protein
VTHEISAFATTRCAPTREYERIADEAIRA